MGKDSKIEWTTHTFNPWIGCTKVSDGCKFCYAETLMDQRYGRVKWGPTGTRQRTSEANWRKPVQWDKQAAKDGIRRKVFCASLADVFEDRRGVDALNYWRAQLWHLIEHTLSLDWLLLTKRPENILAMTPKFWVDSWPSNVWIGTSVEDQATANERIPHLLKVPAKVRFLSCEPLLGPIDIVSNRGEKFLKPVRLGKPGTDGIHWIIAGGESGHSARPTAPTWVRMLRNQCQQRGCAFFFKQWGEWLPDEKAIYAPGWSQLPNIWGANDDGNFKGISRMVYGDAVMNRVGKLAAGRLLDGVEWSQFPT